MAVMATLLLAVVSLLALRSEHRILLELQNIKAAQQASDAQHFLEMRSLRQSFEHDLQRVLDEVKGTSVYNDHAHAQAAQTVQQSVHAALRDHARVVQESTTLANANLTNLLASANLTGVHNRLDELKEHLISASHVALPPTMRGQLPSLSRRAAGTSAASAVATAPLQTPHAPPPSPVHVSFGFEGGTGLGHFASLYWLSHNSDTNATEHLYAEIPAGKAVLEQTYAGECWRVRDSVTGNHLISKYCTSAAQRQTVHIRGAALATLEWHYHPAATQLSAPSIDLYELPGPAPGGYPSTAKHPRALVGRIVSGGHLSTRAKPGTRYLALESGTGRELGLHTVRAEAKQFVTLGAGAVSLEFVNGGRSSGGSTRRLAIFEVKTGDEERLRHASLQPGQAVRLTGMAGERWVVRESDSDRVVLEFAASAEPSQRVHIK